jgi:hypothetical protein
VLRRSPHGGRTSARAALAQAGGARRGGEMTPRAAPASADVAAVTTLNVTPPPPALSLRQLSALHGGLLVTNLIWSFMHVIMCDRAQQRTRRSSVPLRTTLDEPAPHAGPCRCAEARTRLC